MTNKKTVVIATATPKPEQTEAMQHYLKNVMPLLINNEGEVVYRGKVDSQLHGESSFKIVLVIRFPNEDIVRTLFESDEYQSLAPYRDKGFKDFGIVLSSEMG
ncbi:DUF1330 domain-containing protein [Dongshaea marina]|uniref:DUF1330 domain-containing protein n=1 Tax=Dongshaea marina TaxID=2047966 RepID=UPI000D3EABCB|nr:DUF1330 domain-containing protein [Dongshaea marina]